MPTIEETPDAAAAAAQLPVREMNDPRSLRALAHPVRLELLEALAVEGPLTATEAGAIIGESATTCSFHLRQLARYGFVEDAGERGSRERPWRLVAVAMHVSDRTGDDEVDLAAAAVGEVFLERSLAKIRRWWSARSSLSPEWEEATGLHQSVVFATVSEMAELRAELARTLNRFNDRLKDPSARPDGAEPVEVLLFAINSRSPKGG